MNNAGIQAFNVNNFDLVAITLLQRNTKYV